MSVSSRVLRLVLRHVLMRMEVYFCVMIVLVEPGVALSLSYDTLLPFCIGFLNFQDVNVYRTVNLICIIVHVVMLVKTNCLISSCRFRDFGTWA